MTLHGTSPSARRPVGAGVPISGALDCQLQVLFEDTTPATAALRLRSRTLRVGSFVRDHLGEAHLRLGGLWASMRRRDGSRRSPETDPIESRTKLATVGEDVWVRVLPASEIHKMLDESGCSDGLRFMKGMEEYCGGTFAVLRRVQAIFDERAWEMRRIRSTVLLKDVVCRGRYMGDREGCDRCCFFFWKEQWLRKL